MVKYLHSTTLSDVYECNIYSLSPANTRHLEYYHMPIPIFEAMCHCKDFGQNLDCEVTLQYNYSLT